MNTIDLQMQHMKALGTGSRIPHLPTKAGGVAGEDARLKEVCEQFESIFLKQMLDAMRKTVDKSGFIEGGMAEELFDDMLYDEYAKQMAKTGSYGIARMLYDQLSSGTGTPRKPLYR